MGSRLSSYLATDNLIDPFGDVTLPASTSPASTQDPATADSLPRTCGIPSHLYT